MPSGLPPTRNRHRLSKTMGDLAGPCLFAVTMGISRVIYGKYGDRMNLMSFMMGSGGLCLICYLMASISANPMIGLIGCILCGFSVGIMGRAPSAFLLRDFLPAALPVRSSGHGGGSGRSVWPRPGGSRYPECRRQPQKGMLAGCAFPLILILALLAMRSSKEEKKEAESVM